MTEIDPTQGLRGEQGQTGREGRPGQTGQEGKPGQTGQTGKEGTPGMPGAQGTEGMPGKTGPATPTLKLTDRRLMFVFVAMLALFGLLAWRSEVNADAIRAANHHTDVATYHSCITRNANVDRANTFYQAMADLEASNKFIDAKLRAARVKLYHDLVYTPVNCGSKP